MPVQSKLWCFTLHTHWTAPADDITNTPTHAAVTAWWPTVALKLESDEAQELLKAVVLQLERAPTTGKIHLQGAFSFKTKRTAAAVNGLLAGVVAGGHAHVLKCKGTWADQVAYCTDAETAVRGIGGAFYRFAFGEGEGAQGARTDLKEFAAAIVANPTGDVGTDFDHMVLKYAAGMNALRSVALGRKWVAGPVRFVVLWGPTRSGKTTMALQMLKDAGYSEDDIWTNGASVSAFYEGYQGHGAVIWNEYGRETRRPVNEFKCLHDGVTKFTVPVKGASMPWNAKMVIFTSNHAPGTWYGESKVEDQAAVKARINEIFYVEKNPAGPMAVPYNRKTAVTFECGTGLHPLPPPWVQELAIDDDDETVILGAGPLPDVDVGQWFLPASL